MLQQSGRMPFSRLLQRHIAGDELDVPAHVYQGDVYGSVVGECSMSTVLHAKYDRPSPCR